MLQVCFTTPTPRVSVVKAAIQHQPDFNDGLPFRLHLPVYVAISKATPV
ncbi:MAG: hypothetical protein IPP71_12180 [Bacteroidetes bacterium]|nr:hypothetical protein [Bacteroidota bacterium]